MAAKEIAVRIKARCKEKSLAISAVLKACGINRNFIYDLEHNDRSPSCDKIIKLADYLDCSADYLLGRMDNPKMSK